jgi:hypothetical protein
LDFRLVVSGLIDDGNESTPLAGRNNDRERHTIHEEM